MMTVAELIEHLKGLPQDAVVAVYQADEDYGELTSDQIDVEHDYSLWDDRLRKFTVRDVLVRL